MYFTGKRPWRAGATAALIFLATAAIQTAHTARACVLDVIVLETFRVDIDAAEKRYGPGDTAAIGLTVTRPAREDPLGVGVPLDSPVSRPAEGIVSAVAVSVADEYLFAFADPTDAAGKATARVKIPSSTPTGKPVRVAAFAWKTQLDAPCSKVVEQGSIERDEAFEINQ